MRDDGLTLRHELKHAINQADYLILARRLATFFGRDRHAGVNGEYRVRSLYFDNVDDRALRDKIEGFERRGKVRLPMYDSNTSYIRLEKKFRRNGWGAKRSTAIPVAQVEALLAGEHHWLRDSDDPLLLEFYSKTQTQQLRPKTVVEYIRQPFVFPAGNIRLCLDRQIRTGLRCTDLLNPDMLLLDAGEAYAVLEVKYDHFIPDLVLGAIRIPGRYQTAFSKYAIGRRYD